MTFCKQLARAEKANGETVTAYEMQDKFSTAKRYEISISRNGYEIETIKCAKTTWNRKFNENI